MDAYKKKVVNDTLQTPENWWAPESGVLLKQLQTTAEGLDVDEAQRRLQQFGFNRLEPPAFSKPLWLLARQFKSPLVIILVLAAGVSFSMGEWIDAIIMLLIVGASAFLGFLQEYNAGNAVEKLRKRIALKTSVLRAGKPEEAAAENLAPGDVILLSAGSLIPADCRILRADDFFVNQAVLTGETFPVEKRPGCVPATAALQERSNCIFMGTSVRSGSAAALVVATGKSTAYGAIADTLRLRARETEFERGIRRFGALLTQVMTLLVLLVFAVNVVLHKPAVESLLFAVALAVGITPELLPAIISIALSKGALKMAKHGVIVRQLEALENFGSMDLLCTDKTGTLTQGVVQLDAALDPEGRPDDGVFLQAYLNASLQTGLPNPLDEAIAALPKPEKASIYAKTEEIPYDFVRKRLSIAVHADELPAGQDLLITKGALSKVLEVCGTVRSGAQQEPLTPERIAAIEQLFLQYSNQGFRVLGIAVKTLPHCPEYPVSAEQDMVFSGFLLFFDPPKPGAAEALKVLRKMGVSLKIITGDNLQVARHVAASVGLAVEGVMSGKELERLHDEAFWQRAAHTTIFAEVDPNQKERIIRALQKTGHVVGYMGDGINDAPALHAADVGISVENAVDVAKESADFVLLRQDLDVLRQGIEQGRRTFANTLKYVFITTSANFGNMLSMAGLSVFIPFLPLLPKQILLNNFLSDFPAMTIAGDGVDPEFIQKPRRWNVRFIRNFMVVFGLISSVFDYLTFGVLLWWLRVGETAFQTAWFIESLLTELAILLLVRTRRRAWKSRPGPWLWGSSLAVALVALAMPYWPPVARLFGFEPLPVYLLFLLIGITLAYSAVNEAVKHWFFRREKL